VIIATGLTYDKATPETLIHSHYHLQASYSLPRSFHLLQQAGYVCMCVRAGCRNGTWNNNASVWRHRVVLAAGICMRYRYSENYLTQEVDERGSLSMLSGCATRGFFSVLATIRLKSTPFPLLLMQYVPPPLAKLARLDVNWQTIKKQIDI